MSTKLESTKLTVLAGLFAVLLPVAQAQQAGDRAGAIQQVVSAWGSQAGPAEQFQATLNAASDGKLSSLLSATSLQQVRSILLGNLAAQAGGNGVMALGDSSEDLVFTPNNPPCRVFDTRNIGAGTAPAAASTSSYQVYGNAATITAQGGNPAGCAAPKGEPVAVSANFTAVPVGFQGHIRVFPFGGTLPTVSFVNFNGVVGNNIANSGIVSTCYICAFDLSVYNGSQTHHVGDVMGYFYPATFNNIDLPNSTASTGNILKSGSRFIHNFGTGNTFIGQDAGNFTMSNGANTGTGFLALSSNTTGGGNTANGNGALFSNTTGGFNTASGFNALALNTAGSENTATGFGALVNNTTGSSNTAAGVQALAGNTTGASNTASGYQALTNNTVGSFNTATGRRSLNSNTIGTFNTAIGYTALVNNTSGNSNTATGASALVGNTTGIANTAIGQSALSNNTTGQYNIAVGIGAGGNQTTGSTNIYLGHEGVATESNTIRIGSYTGVPYVHSRYFAAGVRGVTTGLADAIPVLIDSFGQLGTANSSSRVKQDIARMGDASSVLMDLRPVTFRYRTHGDDATLQYGLIAEEVAEAAPGLVARSANGEAETVYYQHLAPMLVNEYQKQQARIAELEQDRDKQRKEIAELKQQSARVAELEQQTRRMAELIDRLGRMEVAAGR